MRFWSCKFRGMTRMLVLILSMLILTGCGSEKVEWSLTVEMPGETPLPEAADELFMAIVVDEGVERHPLLTRSRDLLSIYGLVYEGLFSFDEKMQPKNELAESCEPIIAEDGAVTGRTKYIIKLRNNIVFQDGKRLVAKDVEFTFNKIQNGGDQSPYRNVAKMIESCVAIDEKTLEITPYKNGRAFIYACTFPIIPEGSSNTYPLGTGPYKMDSENDGFKIGLTVNPLWWKKAPTIKNVTVMVYPSIDGALTAFDQRDVSLTASKVASIAQYRNMPGVESIAYQTREFECLIPNLSSSIVGQKLMREVITLAIDRKAVGVSVYLNQAVVVDVPVSTLSGIYEQRATLPQQDINKAKALLAEAGWGYPDDKGILYSLPSGMAPPNIPFDKPLATPKPTKAPPTPVPEITEESRAVEAKKPLTDRDGNIIYNNNGEPIYVVDLSKAEPKENTTQDAVNSEDVSNEVTQGGSRQIVIPITSSTTEPTPTPQERYGLKRLEFELMTNDDAKHPEHREAAQVICDQLAVIGISVNVVALPFDEFTKRLNERDFDMALTSIYLDTVPDFTPLVGSGGSLNFAGYASAEMDAALSDAEEALDETDLKNAVSRVQQKIINDLPMIPLYFHTGTLITRWAFKPVNLWEPDIFKIILSWGKD